MPPRKKTRTLNVRLLRKAYEPEGSFTESFSPDGDRPLSRMDWSGVDGGELYVGQIFRKRPDWLGFLEANTDELPDNLSASGAGAVLFLPVAGRVFALCFGHAHITLNDDAFVPHFGLKVALNSVPRDGLRTLDLATPDAVTFQKRVQASKDSDLQAFGVDLLRDLARVAGGTPTDRLFAKFVAGKDALSITCEVEADGLESKCEEILDSFSAKRYRNDFAWVDNMQVVTLKATLTRLDAKLFQALDELRQGGTNELHMAPPEIVNYTEGGQLHYNGFGSHGVNFNDLSIEDYVSELNRCGCTDDIDLIKKNHRIRAQKDASGEFNERWRVYDCFTFETSLGKQGADRYHVLFAGKWYRVEKGFRARVEAHFNSLKQVSLIGATGCRNERELIEDLVKNRPDILMLDQTKINPQGVRYANIEPCDFYSKNREFIHLKDGHSSGPISHLWSQGVVSAEALVSDADFRSKLREVVRKKGGGFEAFLPSGKASKFPRQDYTVVYGIMRKPYADGSIDLPFFSKVSLQAACERIRQFGLSIAIELIEKPA
ncbi:sporadically distributed protein, TIGR04141 family [Pseudomonas sp. GM50]|uniref:DUF6119 family protein n=1 Tax=Pseudomonas sp. GM50 TaxID=1144332 RepID=UPI000270B7F8|nr:DUF6119 family protein [Pseudomonas sp. GM50]EJM67012.1 sporadically distributed protein, TIGR04141 family [Pseudomonas sp. GM50]